MSEHVRSTRCRPSGDRSRRWITLTTIVAMLGFAGLVFADAGNNQVHRNGPASKVAKPLAVNDSGPGSPQGDNGPPTGGLEHLAAPANDTCAGAIVLPLNRTVIATTAGAADDYQAPATAACFSGEGQLPTTAPGRDIVFSFTAPSAGKYSVRVIQQGPNSDPTRTQNAVLYASDSCPSSGTVNCIEGANRPQSSAFISATGTSSNHSEELTCLDLAASQTIYVFFDDAGVAGTPANAGGTTSLEAIPCASETEPNDNLAGANAFQCGILGTSTSGANAHCYLGTRAGAVCTRTTPLDQSFAISTKICSITGGSCTVDAATGISTCPGGVLDFCQQYTDLDCDPRCDVGPNAGLSCTTNGFCNPGSDQGAICAGTCQIEPVCVNAAGTPGIPCTPICVGGLFPGRYCASSGNSGAGTGGCPGAGVCTTSAMCPAGSVCSRQYNEGDVDFFALGSFPASSKVFATVDGKSANDQDWRLRVTSDTKTLQFDDDSGIGRNGATSPMLAGALTTAGEATYLKVSRTSARAAEPYELNAIVRGPVATAQLESEAGPTGNDIYFGWPGDVLNANYATSGGYVRGSFSVNGDSDCFKFIVNEGDLMDWYGDGNPARTAGVTAIVNIPWPIIYDAEPAPISNFIFGMSPGRANTNAATQAAGLSNTSPNVGPPGHLQWRAVYTGMLEVCFYDDSAALGLGTPNHPGAWAGSLSVDCQPIRPAGPGSTTTDVGITKSVSAGPYLTGSFVTYTITLTNSSSDIAQEIDMIDVLDLNLSFVSLTVNDGFGGNNTFCLTLPTPGTADAPIDCITPSLAPGATSVYTLTAQINNCIGAGVHIPNSASITTVSTDTDPSNDSASADIDTTEDGSCADLLCTTTDCVRNLCTVNDHCDAGVCVFDPRVCDDNSSCTDDTCVPATGCVFDSSQNGDLCDDFNVCTLNTCDGSLPGPVPANCVFPPAPNTTSCDDGQTCTPGSDHCDGNGGCTGTSLCDDNNPCTDDFCDETTHACTYVNNTSACDDGDACTSSDTCDAGACVGGAAVVCTDNDACNGVETCDPASGCVAGTALVCNDNDVCNGVETCDAATGCVAGTALVCNDNDACNGLETCDAATGCVAGTAVVCTASDECHVAGTCDPGTGTCSNPAADDGTVCSTGTCISGVCVPVSSCQIVPKPKKAGYYRKLCHQGHSHPNYGDALTNADAACVGSLTTTFAGISTVEDVCDVIEKDNHNAPHGDGSAGKSCDKAEDELMALALNICRQRICLDQEVDSHCSGDPHQSTPTTVAASLATTDALLSDPARNSNTCKDARCLAREINNGHGIHHTSLLLSKAPGGKVLLTWNSPVLDDGSGEATGYTIWRRPMGSSDAFTQVKKTSAGELSYLDPTAGTWEYEVTFTIAP